MPASVPILSACMLLTGTLFTLMLKLQDTVVVGHRPDGSPITFQHPAVQTACMFAGEALCLVPHFLYRVWAPKLQERSVADRAESAARHRAAFWAFSLPALCDAGATTLLNAGLFYTSASACQMLRGTLVVFAGLLTILLLKRRLYAHHWLGMALICAGAAMVGASSIIYGGDGARKPETAELAGVVASVGVGAVGSHAGRLRRSLLSMVDGVVPAGLKTAATGSLAGVRPSAPNPMLGNLLVIGAQLLSASQFIGEEKLLAKHRAPVLLAVGVEGVWGLLISAMALPILGAVHGPSGGPLDSLPAALAAIRASPTLLWSTIGGVASIGAFNFFGVSVTKHLSGGSRATIDACRTIFVWAASVWMGWESAHLLQLLGFVVLISGTSVYNEILRSCMPVAPEPTLPSVGDLEDPLLLGSGPGSSSTAGSGPPTSRGVRIAGGGGTGPSAARATGRPPRPRGPAYTMARSVTILPAALSPHSLASPSRRGGGALGAAVSSFASSAALGEEDSASELEGGSPQTSLPPSTSSQLNLLGTVADSEARGTR